MEALKFAVLLLVFVFVQVFGTLGNPLSRQEEDGETWGLDNWQVGNEIGKSLKISIISINLFFFKLANNKYKRKTLKHCVETSS